MTIPIGIDLGTTFSLIAQLGADGRPVIIPQLDGKTSVPSAVAWDDGQILVGAEAIELQGFGSTPVATYFKRSMGSNDFPLEIDGEIYTAPRLSSFVLKYLKDTADKRLPEPVTHAVITVPAYFLNASREATMEAAWLAGIEPLSIINEPTAAALAYGIQASSQGGIALVYDLGGGTFDVSLVEITSNDLRVIATDGNHELGGKNWDDRLTTEIISRFRADYGEEPSGSDLDHLMTGAEKMKRALSQRSRANIMVTANGRSGSYEVTRDEFENISRDLVELTRALTERVLIEARIGWDQITHVIPVGGSTRLPMVRQLLTEMSGKQPVMGVNPDEAVALGAAIQAALDLERRSPNAPTMLIAGRRTVSDVMSHSLGMIAASDDNSRYINSHLIRKNQPVPAEETKTYRLPLNPRRENKLQVFVTQGELTEPGACVYLDVYAFTGIPNSGEKFADIDVTFAYDRNGVVQVRGVETSSRTPLTLSREPLPPDVPERFLGSPADAVANANADIFLVFDVSGSMRGIPLAEAQKAAMAFIEECELGPIRIGIMEVSDSTKMLIAPSGKEKKIKDAIRQLRVGDTGVGNSGHPFDQLFEQLNDDRNARYAVVLADGVWSYQERAVERAKRCHEAGIGIVGVGFGSADERFLRDISNMDLGGLTDLNKLTETFTTIAQEIGSGPVVQGGLLRRPGR